MISRIIMWLMWVMFAVMELVMPLFSKFPESNASKPVLFTIGMFLVPTLVCGGLWALTMFIQNRWLMLFPYLAGVFFACQTFLYGVFLPDHYMLFRLLSASLLLAFLPVFFPLDSSTPDR